VAKECKVGKIVVKLRNQKIDFARRALAWIESQIPTVTVFFDDGWLRLSGNARPLGRRALCPCTTSRAVNSEIDIYFRFLPTDMISD
jgi:hypothetical protein